MKAPILQDTQWEQLLLHTWTMDRPAMYRLLVILIRKLGLRPMEIAKLDSRWFYGGSLRLPLGSSKRKSGRTLPVDAEIMEALAEHLRGRTGIVFLNRYGRPFSAQGMSGAVCRLFREAGVDGSAYSGRRTAGQRMLDNGVNLLAIQKFYGHSNIQTTLSYIECSEEQLRRAMFA